MTKIYCWNEDCPYYKKARNPANRGKCSCREIFMTFGDGEMCQVTGYSSYCPYSTVKYNSEENDD